ELARLRPLAQLVQAPVGCGDRHPCSAFSLASDASISSPAFWVTMSPIGPWMPPPENSASYETVGPSAEIVVASCAPIGPAPLRTSLVCGSSASTVHATSAG